MSYLHLAMEGKFWKQVDHPPTPEEMQYVKERSIDILRYYRGKFQRINGDGQWEDVAAIPKEWSKILNKRNNSVP